MNNRDWYGSTSSTSSGYWMKSPPSKRVKFSSKEIAEELVKIAEEQEDDKEKHLPIFDPKDLDI